MYDTDFLYWPKMNEFFHNVVKEFLNLYSKFAPLEKIMLTEFHVKQVKWYQFIQNQVKFVLVKQFLIHSMC